MFGFSKIFRSRWRALFWSAGILWMAIEVAAPDAPPFPVAASGASDDPDPELKALKALADLEARRR